MITIPLQPDTKTALSRNLVLKGFTVDIFNKKIVLLWLLHVLRNDGSTSNESQDYTQVADNDTLVDLSQLPTIALYSKDQAAAQNLSNTMGEYDFWWFTNNNQPQPIASFLQWAGNQFAIKNNWL